VARVFLDTNVLAYRFDGSEPRKQARAAELLSSTEHEFVVSTQVLLELYQVLTRKLIPPLPTSAARQVIVTLSRLPVVGADAHLVLRASETSETHQLSIWDAMILEAAADGLCPQVWTEDLGAGRRIRGVEVVNPFGTMS